MSKKYCLILYSESYTTMDNTFWTNGINNDVEKNIVPIGQMLL